MKELIALLMRWAAIEPDRCQVEHDAEKDWHCVTLKGGTAEKPTLAIVWLKDSVEEWDWAVIERAVKKAATARKLLYKVENTEEGNCYVNIIRRSEGWTTSTWYFHTEETIAILTPYVQMLEALRDRAIELGGAA